ncbi:MAG: protein-disulfide reductase DsbD family protein [Porticoccaceae bacterium]
MTARHRWILWLCLLAGYGIPALAATGLGADTNRLQSDTPRFLPVEAAYSVHPRVDGNSLVLDWTIAPGYYLYRDRFKVAATLPDGKALPVTPVFESGTLKYDDYYQKELEVYYDTTRVIVPVVQSPDKITVTLSSQGCADAGLCYPPRIQVIDVDFRSGLARATAAPPPATRSENHSLPLTTLLVFALLGGIILNLMPCVFPILSLKVLRVATAQLSPHGKHRHSIAYALGVVLSFVLVAGILMILRHAGAAVGWGFQLQHPLFVSFLAFLFFLVALGFSGRFPFGARLMNLGQATTEGSSLRSSFMTGILATVAASPCTAPFMGTALGAALTQPPMIGMLIFIALGVGMALPFLLLTWVPGLAKILPTPGPWMGMFREFLAFPLYLTVIWLLWLLGRQTSIDRVLGVGVGLLLIALAIWIQGNTRRLPGKALALAVALIALALPFAPLDDHQPPFWEPYSAARLKELRGEGQPVLVNLTADWCITCLANEQLALSSEDFRQALRAEGIHYLKGDWTNNNPEITALLTEYGRSGVPLYLFFARGEGSARILPQLLTPATVLAAIRSEPAGPEPP